jgi:hypothetical protein
MGVPNRFYTSGRCETCDKITVIRDCNYMLLQSSDAESHQRVLKKLMESD